MTKHKNPKILVTGATGTVGEALTKLLSARGILYREMVREPKIVGRAAESRAGAEIVAGDFDDEKSIDAALEGIERAFLLTNSSERAETRQMKFVEAARRAGVKHIVKLSQWAADADSPVRFLRYHAAVEKQIIESGLEYTFLRPNLFMQGLLGFRESIVSQGKFFAPIGDAKISVVDVRDIAAVAAVALIEDGHANRIYNITGPEALSHGEMAEKLASAVRRPVQFVDVPPESMRAALAEYGFPAWQLEGLIEDYAHYARGEAAAVQPGVLEATGNEPRSFDRFARDYAPAFS